jgi:hypothetical protein
MGKERFPVETDERATFIGSTKSMNLNGQQREVLTVYRIVDDGETIQLRGPDRGDIRKEMEQRERNSDRNRGDNRDRNRNNSNDR